MIESKYLIVIVVIICLLVLYYFYDEISNLKKLFVPTYQKTMALEAKIMELDKKTIEINHKRALPSSRKIDSPALSITYNSDMVKNGNLSVKYADLSESEAKRLLHNINDNKKQPIALPPTNNHNSNPNSNSNGNQMHVPRVQSGELSDISVEPSHDINKINHNGEIYNEETDTINLKLSEIFHKDPSEMFGLNKQTTNYEQLLNDFSSEAPMPLRDEGTPKNMGTMSDELDADIIRSISESIRYGGAPSEDELSDIPILTKTPAKKPNKKSKKNSQKIGCQKIGCKKKHPQKRKRVVLEADQEKM